MNSPIFYMLYPKITWDTPFSILSPSSLVNFTYPISCASSQLKVVKFRCTDEYYSNYLISIQTFYVKS